MVVLPGGEEAVLERAVALSASAGTGTDGWAAGCCGQTLYRRNGGRPQPHFWVRGMGGCRFGVDGQGFLVDCALSKLLGKLVGAEGPASRCSFGYGIGVSSSASFRNNWWCENEECRRSPLTATVELCLVLCLVTSLSPALCASWNHDE